MFKAIFFDLDGTLVDSKLDFDKMRLDLGFPQGVPILEEVDKINDPIRREECLAIIHQHELKGAEDSILIDGVAEVLKFLSLPSGILTRNSRACTQMMLDKHEVDLEHVLTREDCAPKPHPAGLIKLSELNQVSPSDCLYVGDFHFDIITAHNAGMKAALYTGGNSLDFEDQADFTFANYYDFRSRFLES